VLGRQAGRGAERAVVPAVGVRRQLYGELDLRTVRSIGLMDRRLLFSAMAESLRLKDNPRRPRRAGRSSGVICDSDWLAAVTKLLVLRVRNQDFNHPSSHFITATTPDRRLASCSDDTVANILDKRYDRIDDFLQNTS
jgi:hypothetical protein